MRYKLLIFGYFFRKYYYVSIIYGMDLVLKLNDIFNVIRLLLLYLWFKYYMDVVYYFRFIIIIFLYLVYG